MQDFSSCSFISLAMVALSVVSSLVTMGFRYSEVTSPGDQSLSHLPESSENESLPRLLSVNINEA